MLIIEKSRGKEHPSSVRHLINLATSYSRSKDYVQAEHLLRTSLEIMTKTVRPDNPSITFPMLHLAVNLYHLRRDEEAEELALKALHIRESAFGKDSLPVGKKLLLYRRSYDWVSWVSVSCLDHFEFLLFMFFALVST